MQINNQNCKTEFISIIRWTLSIHKDRTSTKNIRMPPNKKNKSQHEQQKVNTIKYSSQSRLDQETKATGQPEKDNVTSQPEAMPEDNRTDIAGCSTSENINKAKAVEEFLRQQTENLKTIGEGLRVIQVEDTKEGLRLYYNNTPNAVGLFLKDYKELAAFIKDSVTISQALIAIRTNLSILHNMIPTIVPDNAPNITSENWKTTLPPFMAQTTRLLEELNERNKTIFPEKPFVTRLAEHVIENNMPTTPITPPPPETMDTMTAHTTEATTTAAENKVRPMRQTQAEQNQYVDFRKNRTLRKTIDIKARFSDESLNKHRFNEEDLTTFRSTRRLFSTWFKTVATNKIRAAIYKEREIIQQITQLDHIIIAKAFKGALSNIIYWNNGGPFLLNGIFYQPHEWNYTNYQLANHKTFRNPDLWQQHFPQQLQYQPQYQHPVLQTSLW